MKKILFPTVISVLLLSCSITKNDVQILEEQTNVLSNSNILDDSDISPSKNNSQEKVNKIQLENISNKDKSYTFKTRKIKEISYSAKKDSNNYDIFVIINYYDDKGNLKLGANIKVIINFDDVHLAQAINYLEAYNIEIGLLINFGSKSLQFKRLINTKFGDGHANH